MDFHGNHRRHRFHHPRNGRRALQDFCYQPDRPASQVRYFCGSGFRSGAVGTSLTGLLSFLIHCSLPEFALKYFRGKALGLIVPPTLLAAADELIE